MDIFLDLVISDQTLLSAKETSNSLSEMCFFFCLVFGGFFSFFFLFFLEVSGSLLLIYDYGEIQSWGENHWSWLGVPYTV